MKRDINDPRDAVRPLSGEISSDRRSTVRSPLSFARSFIGGTGTRRWQEKREGECGWRSVSVSLANASGDKIFETRADSGSLLRPFRSTLHPFLAIPSALVPPDLYIRSLFSSPVSVDSGEGLSLARSGEMHYVWQRFHSARLSLFSLGRFRRHCAHPAVNSSSAPAPRPPPMKREAREDALSHQRPSSAAGGCAVPSFVFARRVLAMRGCEAFCENMYRAGVVSARSRDGLGTLASSRMPLKAEELNLSTAVIMFISYMRRALSKVDSALIYVAYLFRSRPPFVSLIYLHGPLYTLCSGKKEGRLRTTHLEIRASAVRFVSRGRNRISNARLGIRKIARANTLPGQRPLRILDRGSTSPRIRIERKLDVRIIACRDPLVPDTVRINSRCANNGPTVFPSKASSEFRR